MLYTYVIIPLERYYASDTFAGGYLGKDFSKAFLSWASGLKSLYAKVCLSGSPRKSSSLKKKSPQVLKDMKNDRMLLN